MSEALILGAGLGGLLCGSLLARDSFAVTVLEQGRQAGGALQCFVREGIRFDTGFHSVGGLGPGEPLERVFGPLGLLSLPWIRMEEDEVVLQGRSYPLSACPEGAFLRLNGGGELEMEHVIGPYLQSSWRLRGGGKVLADALIADIRSRGGQVLCGKKATALSGGCVCCADGSSYSAPVIVSSLHPLRTLDLVQDRVRPSYRRTLASYTDGPGIFSVQIKLKPGAIPFVNHAIFLEKTVMIHFGEPDADGFSRSLDLLRFAPAVIPDREALARETLALAARRLPALPEAAERYWTSTPATWERFTGTPGGSAYGPVKADASAFLPARTPIPGLYLTGQGIGLHGVLGVAMAALQTYQAITQQP